MNMARRKLGRFVFIGFLLTMISLSVISLAVHNELGRDAETPLYKIRIAGEIKKPPTMETRFISSKNNIAAGILLAFSDNGEELVTRGITCRFTECYGTFFCTKCGILCRLTFLRPICKAMPVDAEEPILQ